MYRVTVQNRPLATRDTHGNFHLLSPLVVFFVFLCGHSLPLSFFCAPLTSTHFFR